MEERLTQNTINDALATLMGELKGTALIQWIENQAMERLGEVDEVKDDPHKLVLWASELSTLMNLIVKLKAFPGMMNAVNEIKSRLP